MGQYWLPVNLDKKEFVDPHKLGVGLKLGEQVGSFPGTGAALLILCAAMPERRGGGDIVSDPVVGRWAGDRVALIGDYAEKDDIKKKRGDLCPSKIYSACREGKWTDVSEDVAKVIEQEVGGKFEGDGWREFKFGKEWDGVFKEA